MELAELPCICGHPRLAHEHYRGGTDCSLCPRSTCTRFRAVGGLAAALLRRLSRRGRRSPGPRHDVAP